MDKIVWVLYSNGRLSHREQHWIDVNVESYFWWKRQLLLDNIFWKKKTIRLIYVCASFVKSVNFQYTNHTNSETV